ncbi:MAG: hypothetical protein HC904_17460 [Blastochloris sp.]|nr:hypothetical protein [Blastochloris sp.]
MNHHSDPLLSFQTHLQTQSIQASVLGLHYTGSQLEQSQSLELADGACLNLGGGRVQLQLQAKDLSPSSIALDLKFSVVEGSCQDIALGLQLHFEQWSEKDWVFLPACVYAGNRFPIYEAYGKPIPHSPEPDPHNWVQLSNAPHLTHGPGPSRFQVLTGDCATPCVGIYSPGFQRGFLLMTDQGTTQGDHALELIESEDRRSARLILKSPGVREGGKYNYPGPLADRPMNLEPGAVFHLRLELHSFPAHSPEDLYAGFLRVRKHLAPQRDRAELPFRSAFQLIEDKHNRESWVEPEGYWSVGMRESSSQNFQTGWVGGPNTIWPLLISGDATSFHRALRAWDFICGSATPSGFVRSCYHQGSWQDHGDRPCYLRYSADTLYFLMKTLLHLRVGPPHVEPRPNWLSLARGLADAFVKVWHEAGHLPHYVHPQTGAVYLGGSCAAALAPAGLALAARFF